MRTGRMTRKASGARRRLALVAIAATVCVGVWGTGESAWAQVSPASGGAYYVSPDGSDEAAGTQEAPFRTIQRAASLVEAGNPAASADLTFKARR
jgi:hypothetical protein